MSAAYCLKKSSPDFLHPFTLTSWLSMQVREHPQRASRVLLDIEAGAPVILIPESSRSPRVIVANLGQLRVQNCFLPAGAHGTFSLRDKVEKLTMAHAFFPSLVSHYAHRLCHPAFLSNSAVFIHGITIISTLKH